MDDISAGLLDDVERRAVRIQCLFEQGRGDEAMGALLSETDPMVGVPRQNPRIATVGTGFLLAGDLQKALAYFSSVLSADDRADLALYGRALAYRLLGQDARANEDLAQAIAIAEGHREGSRSSSDSPVGRLCERYGQEITWAYLIDLPLYHLALGNIQQAEQMYREALSEAPLTLLQLATRRLADFVTLFPDSVQAQALNALLQERPQ